MNDARDIQHKWPRVIQGGMGVAISGWQLARAVALAGELGVVSGTSLNAVFAHRLQHGDESTRQAYTRALGHFPFPSVAEEMLVTHTPNNSTPSRRKAVRNVPMYTLAPSDALLKLTVAASFCEVFLAKERGESADEETGAANQHLPYHSGLVGFNLLEKVQLPNLALLYGAMLAHVDYVLMGAGIPREIPAVLQKLAQHDSCSLKIHVEGRTIERRKDGEDDRVTFDPRRLFSEDTVREDWRWDPLPVPKFFAIVSTDVLAQVLVQKTSGKIDGLVIENALAGGHNAPPRGAMKLTSSGEPIYGPRDTANIENIRALGIPFWLAGDCASPEGLANALDLGAAGIQVGTDFAFCDESGLAPELRKKTLEQFSETDVYTDPVASSTGFPFKVVQLQGTLAEEKEYDARPRVCQLGFLRQTYERPDGKIGYRCPSEPVANYVRKGGKIEDTIGRKCLCNALMANAGLPQEQVSGYIEQPLVTAGDSLKKLGHYLSADRQSYTAGDVLDYLLSPVI